MILGLVRSSVNSSYDMLISYIQPREEGLKLRLQKLRLKQVRLDQQLHASRMLRSVSLSALILSTVSHNHTFDLQLQLSICKHQLQPNFTLQLGHQRTHILQQIQADRMYRAMAMKVHHKGLVRTMLGWRIAMKVQMQKTKLDERQASPMRQVRSSSNPTSSEPDHAHSRYEFDSIGLLSSDFDWCQVQSISSKHPIQQLGLLLIQLRTNNKLLLLRVVAQPLISGQMLSTSHPEISQSSARSAFFMLKSSTKPEMKVQLQVSCVQDRIIMGLA